MAWIDLLRLPMTVLLGLATIFLILALIQGAHVAARVRKGRRVAAGWRSLCCLLYLALAALLGGSGYALRGYHLLTDETPVLQITARQLAPQYWQLTLHAPEGHRRQVQLGGDAWRVEAQVLKWKLPALLAGVPPLYRLERLSGRYDDPARAAASPTSVIDLRQGDNDLLALARRYPRWLPQLDTVFGSGAYLPLVDGGHYTVSLMRTGALVARQENAPAAAASAAQSSMR